MCYPCVCLVQLSGADHILFVFFACVHVCDLDPIPAFDLSVNQLFKSITVTVEPGDKVHARWCYKKNAQCTGGERSPLITVRICGTFICMYALLCVYAKKSFRFFYFIYYYVIYLYGLF